MKLIKLLLVCLASAVSAERSFSGLRRLKIWLRLSISQERLTHLAMLHANQLYFDENAAEVSSAVLQEFISKTEERESTFGPPGQGRTHGGDGGLQLPHQICFYILFTRSVKLYKYNWFTLVLLYRLWASRTNLRLHQIRG